MRSGTRQFRRQSFGFPPLNTLAGELAALRRFRNEPTHTVAYQGNPLQRVKRRRGQNELVTVTAEQIAEHLERGMRCQSALHLVPLYVERHPPTDVAPPPGGAGKPETAPDG